VAGVQILKLHTAGTRDLLHRVGPKKLANDWQKQTDPGHGSNLFATLNNPSWPHTFRTYDSCLCCPSCTTVGAREAGSFLGDVVWAALPSTPPCGFSRRDPWAAVRQIAHRNQMFSFKKCCSGWFQCGRLFKYPDKRRGGRICEHAAASGMDCYGFLIRSITCRPAHGDGGRTGKSRALAKPPLLHGPISMRKRDKV